MVIAAFGNLEVADIVKFVDEGGNLVVATGSNPSDVVRDLAAECGVDFDNEGKFASWQLAPKTTALTHTNWLCRHHGH